jgi:hypothetical protein
MRTRSPRARRSSAAAPSRSYGIPTGCDPRTIIGFSEGAETRHGDGELGRGGTLQRGAATMRAGVGLDLRASRRGHEDMAILPAAELRSLEETAHLMRSPANARRLLAALHRALADEGDAESPAALRADVGLRRWPRKSGRRGFPSSRPNVAKTCATGWRSTAGRRSGCWTWWEQSCATRSAGSASLNH